MSTITRKRSLPDWIQHDTDDVEVDDAENRSSDQNKQEPQRRYSLRSGSTTTPSTTSSSLEPKAKKPYVKPEPIPFIDYKGRVEYYTEFNDIAMSCDTLLQWVNKQETQEIIPIAFDMEWPFSFQTGPGKSAVIQLCADTSLCYVYHISKLAKLPAVMLELLYHPKVRLHGVNIKNDFRKLERDYPAVNSQKLVDQCVDLGVWCNEVTNSSGRWSMENLVKFICRLRINKDGKVRRSKWDVQPLSPEQQLYAAIDVYISQVIYLELDRRNKENEIKKQEFIEKHGDESFEDLKLSKFYRNNFKLLN